MNYSKQKAEKLKHSFSYIIGKDYFPYGVESKPYKIDSLDAVSKKINRTTLEYSVFSKNNPTYGDDADQTLSNGNNWFVNVVIKGEDESIIKDLKSVLLRLKIKHDIDDIPN